MENNFDLTSSTHWREISRNESLTGSRCAMVNLDPSLGVSSMSPLTRGCMKRSALEGTSAFLDSCETQLLWNLRRTFSRFSSIASRILLSRNSLSSSKEGTRWSINSCKTGNITEIGIYKRKWRQLTWFRYFSLAFCAKLFIVCYRIFVLGSHSRNFFRPSKAPEFLQNAEENGLRYQRNRTSNELTQLSCHPPSSICTWNAIRCIRNKPMGIQDKST